MLTIRKKLDRFALSYPLEKTVPLDKVLFLDIETTGFAVCNSILYLIGCAYYKEEAWHTIQWFANTKEEEKSILEAFFHFASAYTCLIHFNGNNFDLPFITEKCRQHQLSCDFDRFQGIDLYRRILPFKDILKLPNCKQKTLEQFLGISREDPFDGSKIIGMYHDYLKQPSEFSYNAILFHNSGDLEGMLHIMSLLGYSDLFSAAIRVKKVQANYYQDMSGNRHQELYMKIRLRSPLPRELSLFANGCYFTACKDTGMIKVPVYEETLKYFYADYKEYYYLPAEDVAIHKSIASFVDSENRVQAKASTCYTRKQSSYLPQWDLLFKPYFKRDYDSKELFFEITPELKTDREAFRKYACHIIQMLISFR